LTAIRRSAEAGREQAEVSSVCEAANWDRRWEFSKAHDGKELGPAIAEAAKFDRKIVIEKAWRKETQAREIELRRARQ